MVRVNHDDANLIGSLSPYLPEDRLAELGGAGAVGGGTGSALFADVVGFSLLTTRLAEVLGPRRGAEEVPRYLNTLYEALIGAAREQNGSVVGFAGDAIICWFAGDDGNRATASACAMQVAMAAFSDLAIPLTAATVTLSLKVSVASGAVKRYAVGDPDLQLLDIVVGATVARLEALNGLARRGQVLVDLATAAALRGKVDLALVASTNPVAFVLQWPLRAPKAVPSEARTTVNAAAVARWLLPTIHRRLAAGGGDFITELRPVAALFIAFAGIDFDEDGGAGEKLDWLVRTVQRVASEYGGNVLQLTGGDKGTYVYLAFGAPVAHEDDTGRAAAAALDLRAELLGASFLTDLKMGLGYGTARTGAYGSSGRRTYGALGPETNMAARLMAAAPHGAIHASGAFVNALGEGFVVKALPGLVAKGWPVPVERYDVVSRSGSVAGGQHTTPLAGRQAETAAIRAAVEQAAGGSGRALHVVGEAGVGKSELVAQTLRAAPAVRVVAGACQAFGKTAPYQAWKGVLQQLVGVTQGASAAERTALLESALGPELVGRAALLAPLLDFAVPESDQVAAMSAEDRSAARQALFIALIRQAANATAVAGLTLVVLIEDLNWLDPASEQFLHALTAGLSTMPLLVLTTARPSVERTPDAPLHTTDVINLGPLAEPEARVVVDHLLAALDAKLSPDVISAIVRRSGGNPFFLEELVTDVVQRAAAGARIGDNELPTSLHRLILARLDRLTDEQLVNLKIASVVGLEFEVAFVHACHDGSARDEIVAALEATRQLGLTPLHKSEPLCYAFNHGITRDVTYESQAHETRTRLHTRLAHHIEALTGGADLDVLAYHYGLGDDLPKARHYLAAAAAAAKAVYANEAATTYLSKLLELLHGAERLPALLELGEVMSFVGAHAGAEASLTEALTFAAGTSDEATALRLLGELYERRGEHGPARIRLEAAAKLARAWQDDEELTRVLLALGGNVLWHLGEYGEAADLLQEALALARGRNDPRAGARALHGLANVHLYLGETEAATEALTASLQMRSDAQDEYGVANALNNLAILAANAGDSERAEALFTESLTIRQRLGDVSGVAVALNNLGYMVAKRGDLTEALRLYEESLASRRELGDRLGQAVSLNNLAGLEAQLGAVDVAREHYLESATLSATWGNRREAAAALAGIGSIADDAATAARFLLAAEQLIKELGAAVEPEVEVALNEARSRAAGVQLTAPRFETPQELLAWATANHTPN